ncbi:RNA-binding domain-containing protein [Streptomyces sp. 1222.5]|uniref:RNA-binding domain-containing protein n=1 Tax=Streptomyces sp. 1222.5 TaxID=1881026 RepID=UPI003D7080DD
MELEGIQSVLARGETERIEFKLRPPKSSREFSHLLTSFANSHGGLVVFGVDDSGHPVGLNEGDVKRTTDHLIDISNSLFPQQLGYPRISWEQVIYDDDKWLLLVKVPESPESVKPIRLPDGSVSTRRGTHSVTQRPEVAVSSPIPYRHNPFKIFVSMSFREEEEPALVDYYEAMRRAAKDIGVPHELNRIDREPGDYEIVAQVEERIREADILIADFTMQRPNVYYEAGIARGAGIYTIRCARKDTEVHFDVAARKIILYANATQLEVSLKEALRHAYDDLEERRGRQAAFLPNVRSE